MEKADSEPRTGASSGGRAVRPCLDCTAQVASWCPFFDPEATSCELRDRDRDRDDWADTRRAAERGVL